MGTCPVKYNISYRYRQRLCLSPPATSAWFCLRLHQVDYYVGNDMNQSVNGFEPELTPITKSKQWNWISSSYNGNRCNILLYLQRFSFLDWQAQEYSCHGCNLLGICSSSTNQLFCLHNSGTSLNIQCTLYNSNTKNPRKLGRIIPKLDYRKALLMGDNGSSVAILP